MNANDAIIAASASSHASHADPRHDASRVIRAPRGSQLTCKSWLTEAAYRMIQNNLDPEVAERPQDLVVYGGIGRAARNWECFDQILASLKDLNDDETLLIQSGKPVGVFKTHANAPRVLLANSNLVPKWANWEHFSELDQKGLFMYGQMTAGSWIYIGTQGIVQGTYETFAEAGRKHYGGSLEGKWILTAGLGGMGGAQPLAATFAGAVSLNIECQQSSIDFRLRTRYVDKQAKDVDDALALIKHHTEKGEAVSIALLGNAAEVLPELVRRAKAGGIRPDIVTDQTSAHDPLSYLPLGYEFADMAEAPQPQAVAVADIGARRRQDRALETQLGGLAQPALHGAGRLAVLAQARHAVHLILVGRRRQVLAVAQQEHRIGLQAFGAVVRQLFEPAVSRCQAGIPTDN